MPANHDHQAAIDPSSEDMIAPGLRRRSVLGLLAAAPLAAMSSPAVATPITEFRIPDTIGYMAEFSNADFRRVNRGPLKWVDEPPFIDSGFPSAMVKSDDPNWPPLHDALFNTKIHLRRRMLDAIDHQTENLNLIVLLQKEQGRLPFALSDKPVRHKGRDMFLGVIMRNQVYFETDFLRLLHEMERKGQIKFA